MGRGTTPFSSYCRRYSSSASLDAISSFLPSLPSFPLPEGRVSTSSFASHFGDSGGCCPTLYSSPSLDSCPYFPQPFT